MTATDWRDRAACAETDIRLFYPGRTAPTADRLKAIALCRACPVQVDCLEDDLVVTTKDQTRFFGIRGGMTAPERERLVKARKQRIRGSVPKPINHGTIGGYRTHLRRNDPACDSCLAANAEMAESRRRRVAS